MPTPIVCLMGPTCSGKTQLAIELVQRLPCSIISVDSAMVYRGMDIGTAKPNRQQLALAPHRLIDICDPAEPFSAGQFRAAALEEITQITAAGRIPLLVGGTMLYFHALQRGLNPLPPADAKLRQTLTAEAQALGWAALHARLTAIDPAAAARIHPNDAQRIQRALEIYLLTGQSMTTFLAQTVPNALSQPMLNIVIAPQDRQVLQPRIQQRWQQMLTQGLIAEVERLYQRPDLNPDLPALRAVGYKQVWAYLAGQLDYAAMSEQALIATRQLAKRQFTWLRSWQNAVWFDSQDSSGLAKILHCIESADC